MVTSKTANRTSQLTLGLCILAIVNLSGCVSSTPHIAVDGKPYYGSDATSLRIDQKVASGLVPKRIQCIQWRWGPGANLKDVSGTKLTWTKSKTSPPPYWMFVTAPNPRFAEAEALAKSKGLRKISSDRFYHSVQKEWFYCAIWSAG